MSFGKLYSNSTNSRTVGILSIAKENGIDLELVETKTGADFPAELAAKSPLKRIPFFESGDFFLSESLAIAIYLTSQNEKTTLLGKSKQEYAQILRWMSFGTGDVLPALANWFRPLLGMEPYNKKNVETSQATATTAIAMLDNHLFTRTYLVGQRPTAADFYLAGIVSKGFQYVFDASFRKSYPNFSRWWATIANQPSYVGKFEFIEEAIKFTPQKVEKAVKPAKAAAAPAPKKAEPKPAAEEEEEEDKPAPKPKHPLEALGRTQLVLDDWKRKYSNSDTRSDALPWFWENYNPEEWSLWRVDYKYNNELTQIFMTSNLIGGFFNRLEASRKYLFGAASVYGESNASVVQGAFLVRGQEAEPAFDVAPDYESYTFSKLDPTNPDDKEFVATQWAWDKPAVVGGKEYQHADGKVFK